MIASTDMLHFCVGIEIIADIASWVSLHYIPLSLRILLLFIKPWLAFYGLTQLIMSRSDDHAWFLIWLKFFLKPSLYTLRQNKLQHNLSLSIIMIINNNLDCLMCRWWQAVLGWQSEPTWEIWDIYWFNCRPGMSSNITCVTKLCNFGTSDMPISLLLQLCNPDYLRWLLQILCHVQLEHK